MKPNIGISFNGKQLPFRDINSVGTINNINKKGSAFVYADTNGIQVKLSNHIPLELAEAIAKEIKAASGIEWK